MKRKKLIAILLSIVITVSIAVSSAMSAQAASNPTDTYSFSIGVGGDLEPFTYDVIFDSDKGILRAKYNTVFFKEIGVQVFHTTNSHYGTVVCGNRTNSTEVASYGDWTSRADVRTDQSNKGTVTAFY